MVTGKWEICYLDSYFGSLSLLWSVFINNDCNKCGQTSCLAAGAQIQTSCNCEKDIHCYNCLLDCFCFWCTTFYSYMRVCSLHRYSAVLSHHNRRLLKNFQASVCVITKFIGSTPYKERAKQFKWTQLDTETQCTVHCGCRQHWSFVICHLS